MVKFIVAILVMLMSFAVVAAPVVIINKSIKEPISKYRVKQLYLAQKQTLKSGLSMEVLMPSEQIIRIAFVKDVLHTNERRLQRKYNKAVFSGESNIPVTKSSQEILAIVKQKSNVIGVVDESLVDDSVRIIAM